jgi:hypothetical protein
MLASIRGTCILDSYCIAMSGAISLVLPRLMCSLMAFCVIGIRDRYVIARACYIQNHFSTFASFPVGHKCLNLLQL